MWRSLSRSLSVVPGIPGSEDVRCVRSCLSAVWFTHPHHPDTVTIASREQRQDNPVSMWSTSGYHLGRASVKLVFIENCQMVICKYLCKMFWKLCNSIYRNIVKSLLHITNISYHFLEEHSLEGRYAYASHSKSFPSSLLNTWFITLTALETICYVYFDF